MSFLLQTKSMGKMKNIILLIAIIAFVGCDEETPTEQKVNLDKKYTIEELESDPDWVEVTDIDTLEIPCIWYDLYERGKLIKLESEYKDLYEESKILIENSGLPCNNNTDIIDVDFSNRDLILFEVTTGGDPLFKRKIFKNSISNQYRYLLEITFRSVSKVGFSFAEAISIPNISIDTEMIFDTLRNYGEWIE